MSGSGWPVCSTLATSRWTADASGTEMDEVMTVDEPRRPQNLVWLPDRSDGLTTMCRGAVLTITQRGGNQWPWTVTVGGVVVSEGVSPSLEHARTAAIAAAVEAKAAR